MSLKIENQKTFSICENALRSKDTQKSTMFDKGVVQVDL